MCGDIEKRTVLTAVLFFTGDTVNISGTLCYSSSKDTRLKFSLQKKTVYRAYVSSNISDQSLSKVVGETIKANSEETFSFQMSIPADAHPTIHNCEIISVDYYVKVCNKNSSGVILSQ